MHAVLQLMLLCWCVALFARTTKSQLNEEYFHEGCNFYYITQPPAELPCNPYNSSGLRLQCSIVGPNPEDIGTNYTVHWFRKVDTSNETEQIVTDPLNIVEMRVRVNINVSHAQYQSIQFSAHTIIVTEVDAGVYWFEVVFANSSKNVSLQNGQMVRLEQPSTYASYPPCPADVYLGTISAFCADETSTVLPPEDPETPRNSSNSTASSHQSSTAAPSPAFTVVPTTTSALTVHTTPAQQPPTCVPADTNQNSQQSSSSLAGIIAAAVGAPVLAALLLLILALIITRRRRSRRAQKEKRNVPELQVQSSLASLVTIDGEEASNGLSTSTSTSTLPPHLSVIRQPSANSEYTEVPLPQTRASTVIWRLKTACKENSLTPNGTYEEPHQEIENHTYTSLDSGSLQSDHHYNTTASQMNDRVVMDGKEYRIIDPKSQESNRRTAVYTQPKGTASRSIWIPASQREHSGEYVIPHQQEYQGLSSQMQEYMDIYATPDTQNPQLNVVEVGGHQYQLPNSSSMEPVCLYATRDMVEEST